MFRQRTRSLKDLWRCRRGTAAVEFALVAPPLIWILGVLCETGAFITIQYQLQFATEHAARLLRTNQIPSSWTVGQFKGKVCEKFTVPNCAQVIHVDVRHANKFAELNPPQIQAIGPANSGGRYTETFDPGANGEPGSVFITYDWNFIFPFMGNLFGFGNVGNRTDIRRLHGSTIYMNEMT